MRELKHSPLREQRLARCRTLPRVRELKLIVSHFIDSLFLCRTLPRVRELKPQVVNRLIDGLARRTLPRVRELKHEPQHLCEVACVVAPFPGCVN